MNARPDWWSDFFSGLFADFWRSALPPEVTGREADLLQRRLGVASGAHVLDVPCGHGRLAIELARRGFRVTGQMIEEAGFSIRDLLGSTAEDEYRPGSPQLFLVARKAR